MFEEFKKFIMRGNVIDLAVGVIIGASFGAIVTSLVNDILMPPIGLILGGVDFSNLFIDLSGVGYESLAAAQEAGAATINYGLFINNLINFLIVALVIFMLVRSINHLLEIGARKEAAEAAAAAAAAAEVIKPDPQAELLVAINRLTDTIAAQGPPRS